MMPIRTVRELAELIVKVKLAELAKDKCECGHVRRSHKAIRSANYTEGPCKTCKCNYFVIKSL